LHFEAHSRAQTLKGGDCVKDCERVEAHADFGGGEAGAEGMLDASPSLG